MRKPIIAGNWKMNKTPSEAAALVTELIPLVKDACCDVVVGVPDIASAYKKIEKAANKVLDRVYESFLSNLEGGN